MTNLITYENTPENAQLIGWDDLPEHCEGDSSLPFVRHDHVRGIFVYTDTDPKMDLYREMYREASFECPGDIGSFDNFVAWRKRVEAMFLTRKMEKSNGV